jgi:predicted nucleic acid-binding protein
VGIVYVDTSALVKLIVRERESAALHRAAAGWVRLVSSEIAVVELLRATYRQPHGFRAELERAALKLLGALALHPVTRRLLFDAGRIQPSGLRSLDAIHLVTAMELGDSLERFVTYDQRLAQAARAMSLSVEAPE